MSRRVCCGPCPSLATVSDAALYDSLAMAYSILPYPSGDRAEHDQPVWTTNHSPEG
jgi:hypothetical protein